MPVLNFKGKTAVETHHHAVPHHVLEVNRKLSELTKGVDPCLAGNLIIEGDNLLALKALLPTHAGKVKCVYIDPPYNTGNEGWIYNDNLTQPQFKEWIGREVGKEGEDACRHDKWCCMMYPRLSLLRELLSEDGRIFISIDDNEMHHLRTMMDEVFGEDNRLGVIIWRTRNTDNRVKTNLSCDHEYVLVYARNHGSVRGRIIDRSDFQNPDNDPRGPYVTDPLTGKATADERPNLHFTITNRKTGDKYPPDPARGWITDPAGVADLIQENLVAWPPDPKTGKPRKKRFLSETSERMPISTFWADLKGQSGADEVDGILGERMFAFPKSIEFMERIVDLGSGPNDVVLDSTAGSGTTAHAVLSVNRQDGGNRSFVVIQQPHDSAEHRKAHLNICERITAERIRRVIRGYRVSAGRDKGKRREGLGGSFTYARVGPPLLGDHRNWGERLPAYDELARYIFFTETGRELEPTEGHPTTGKIGEHGGASYYLLYTPDPKASVPLDQKTLEVLAKDKNPRKVVYCEKVWVHREDLAKMRKEIGEIRTMLLPFQVRAS